MGTFVQRRRLGFTLALALIGCAAVLACSMAFGAAAPTTPTAASAPRISLRAPSQAKAGSRFAVTGAVTGTEPGVAVMLQQRRSGGWRPVGHAAVRKAHFAFTFAAPAKGDLELRATLLVAGEVAAVSPVRRIAVSSAAEAPGKGTPEGSGRGGSPSSTRSSPPATTPTTTQPPASEPPVTEPPVTEPPVTEPPPPPVTNSYWGAWIGDQLTGEEAPWDMNAVTDFESEVGKAPSLVEFSSPFADCSSSPCTNFSFPTTPFEAIRSRGAIPFFSWSSQSIPSSPNEPEYQLSDIAAGNYDTYIRQFATAAAQWGHPFFLRFDWEMNGTWFPWGANVNGNTPADYIAAWRHVHQIFVTAGATNASWVWCPYVNPNSTLVDMSTLYPGDEYVDWTCLDGYNWGPTATPPRKWRSFSFLFGPSYKQITEGVAPTKPMLIGETASAEATSSEPTVSKGEWIEKAFAALPVEFPRIQGLIWFDKEDDGMDWPLESSPGATAAFKASIANPRYLANAYSTLTTSPIPAP
jgi:hypothetical protein